MSDNLRADTIPDQQLKMSVEFGRFQINGTLKDRQEL